MLDPRLIFLKEAVMEDWASLEVLEDGDSITIRVRNAVKSADYINHPQARENARKGHQAVL